MKQQMKVGRQKNNKIRSAKKQKKKKRRKKTEKESKENQMKKKKKKKKRAKKKEEFDPEMNYENHIKLKNENKTAWNPLNYYGPGLICGKKIY
ncbi:hypothetical protein M0812_05183 [Anaeramoeba flamelloides]|uniref:Uncharacterized protein n=1 Tax=Anaeramoeba flamelloides TaxID=1746091 RepID=A0AAV8AEI7_9EUKA|nr:hypothetical protein M0812_05183 [Anaeramoeba flamelloides]